MTNKELLDLYSEYRISSFGQTTATGVYVAVAGVSDGFGGCSIIWLARSPRLARDYERLPQTLVGLHFMAFAMLLLNRFTQSVTFVSSCITAIHEWEPATKG